MDSYQKRARRIIESIAYATVATTDDAGRPWNSPVHTVHDDQYNFYWFSDVQAQHSLNVRTSGRAFLVIYDSTVPAGEGEGVYIDAVAKELNDPEEIRYARYLKKGPGYDASPEGFMGDSPRRVYKAVPERVWVNADEVKDGVFVRDYRVEVQL